MKLNLKRPLVFFDLETTGMSITTDRIVEYSFIKVFPDGSEEVMSSRLNPSMPIPIETSLIHGIYQEDIKDAPLFSDHANDLNAFLTDCDLGGYNLLLFDLPLLIEEFNREEIEFQIENRKIIDSQKIFYLMQPRTLTAAYKFYCGKDLEDAHSAEADTRATYEVFKGQVEMYDGVTIKDKSGEIIEPVKNDVDHVHQHTVSQIADLAGRIVYNHEGVEVFNFGKFKGQPVVSVLKKERGYYDWMMKGDFPAYTKKVLTRIKLQSGNLFN